MVVLAFVSLSVLLLLLLFLPEHHVAMLSSALAVSTECLPLADLSREATAEHNSASASPHPLSPPRGSTDCCERDILVIPRTDKSGLDNKTVF
jgi:hypothetical protein